MSIPRRSCVFIIGASSGTGLGGAEAIRGGDGLRSPSLQRREILQQVGGLLRRQVAQQAVGHQRRRLNRLRSMSATAIRMVRSWALRRTSVLAVFSTSNPWWTWPSLVATATTAYLGSTSRDGSRTCRSSSRLGYFDPTSSRSGPRPTPTPPTRWHPLHPVADSAKNQRPPRTASPVSPRIDSASIAVAEPHHAIGLGEEALEQVADLGPGDGP